MAIKHAFTSGKSDGGDSSLVRASDWNASHVIDSQRAFVDPTTPTWSWINQGGASISTSGPTLWLSSPAESADNWHLRAKTVPSKPYSVIVHLTGTILPVDFSSWGVGWLQTSDNHFAVFNQHSQSGVPHVTSSKSATNYGITANYTDLSGQGEYYKWVKLTDDSSNRKIYLSFDGNNWIQFHSVSTNDFITPDRLIFGINARNATYGAGVMVDSWEEGA